MQQDNNPNTQLQGGFDPSQIDLEQLLESANEFRKNIESMEQDAASIRAEGRSENGLIRVTVNGLHEVLQVKIDKRAVAPENLTKLEPSFKTAVNQAIEKASQQARDRIQEMAKKLGIDPNDFNAPKA